MNTKHTPGPWFPYTGSNGLVHVSPCAIPTVSTAQICTFNGSSFRAKGETEANARLIASAPDLLCMLERILDGVLRLPEMPHTLCALDLEQARQAIARAKNSL